MTSDMKEMVTFQDANEKEQWRIVNDGVMGGLSKSGIEITPAGKSVFKGDLSLENNGGFASVRRLPQDYGLEGYDGVLLRIKGDGRTYQFRVRTNSEFDGVSYQAEFETKPGEWLTAEVPFESLKPTFRGRVVPDAPALQPKDIRQIGFLLGDKRPGSFQLEMEWIQAYRLLETKGLVAFEDPKEKERWRVVNDGVMGGLSKSSIEITSATHAVFQGNLSLENNGGFASIQRQPQDHKLSGYEGFLIRVKGDGRTYQFRVRTDGQFSDVSYQAEFKTKPGEWLTANIPFKSLKPTFRGRAVPDAPVLKPENIQQIGFFLGDKRQGSFRMEIESVQAYKVPLKGKRSSQALQD